MGLYQHNILGGVSWIHTWVLSPVTEPAQRKPKTDCNFYSPMAFQFLSLLAIFIFLEHLFPLRWRCREEPLAELQLPHTHELSYETIFTALLLSPIERSFIFRTLLPQTVSAPWLLCDHATIINLTWTCAFLWLNNRSSIDYIFISMSVDDSCI